jgi:K+-sensing histidine kinase KdpD
VKFLRTVGPTFEEVRVWATAEGEGICFRFAGAAPAKKARARGTDEAASWADRRAYHGFVVAKDIVDALGGEIRVESAPDGEARFSVRLPAVSRG